MKNKLSHRRTRFAAAPAYTLVEMMVVLAIITTLLAIGATGFRNLSKASGVSAGIPIAESVFAQARALAIGKGTDVRVLIHADNDTATSLNRERNLRYMIIQYLDTKETEVTTDDVWVTASKGVKLPDGVFYSLALSGYGAAPNVDNAPDTPALPGGVSATCRYYKFNSQGIIIEPMPDSGTEYGNNVPRFVIRAGFLPPGGTTPKPDSSAGESNASGFVIWRNGRTSVFRHSDQIAPNSFFSDKTKF